MGDDLMRSEHEENVEGEPEEQESEIESSQGSLDEEDLELIRESSHVQEPTAIKKSKRVIEDSDEESMPAGEAADRAGAPSKRQRSLESMFAEEEQVLASSESESEEGLEDFIEHEEREAEVEKQAIPKPKDFVSLWGGTKNISKDAWNDLMDIFGDGSEYTELVWEEEEESEEVSSDELEQVSELDKPKPLATFPDHPQFFAEEAAWIQKEFRRQFSLDTDLKAIERCLELIVSEQLPVPFIAAFKKDLCHPLKLFHIWSIYDWNQRWVQHKRVSMSCGCKSIDNAELVADWIKKLKFEENCEQSGLPVSQFAANVKAWAPLYPPIPHLESCDEDFVLHELLLSDAVDFIVRKIETGIVVTTKPTDTGRKLGNRHDSAALLSLQDKPLQTFSPEQFALLFDAVMHKRCNIEYRLKERDSLLDQMKQLYGYDQCGERIMTRLLDGLVERFLKRLSFTLQRDSHHHIAQCCGVELQSKLVTGLQDTPFTAISWGSGEPGSILGAVKMQGRKLENFETFNISIEFNAEQLSLLLEYLGSDPVVISGTSFNILSLYQKLKQANISVQFGLDDVARIQPKALIDMYPQLQGAHSIIKYSTALGLQYASPCDAFGLLLESELLKLDLHPLQSFISDMDLRVSHLKRALTNVINHQGISIEQPWLFKYISGISINLQNVSTRDDLPAVSSGFIIFPKSPGLDQLRICKDDYTIVQKMLRDAFSDDVSMMSASLDKIIDALQEQPHRLLSLDLADYDRHLGGDRLLMLEEYRRCILSPDLHSASEPKNLSDEAIFWMISGEKEQFLRPGRLVRVRLNQPSTSMSTMGNLERSGLPVKCMLDGDKNKRRGLCDAVVLSVNLHDFALNNPQSIGNVVRVSVHRDDLSDPTKPVGADQYYRRPEPSGSKPEIKEKEKLNVPQAVLHHPVFKGKLSRESAERLLLNAMAGEAIVRLQDNSLIVSFRVCSKYPELISHSALTIENNRYQLSSSRSKQYYEDLDEVIARGIEPNARLLDEIIACPKYIELPLTVSSDKTASQEIERILQAQARNNPGRIAYGLWVSRDVPGSAFLSIAPRHHEPVSIEEGEYMFRRHRFRNLSTLIDHLKKSS